MRKTRDAKKDRHCVLKKWWTEFDDGLDVGGTFSKYLLMTYYCVSVKIGSKWDRVPAFMEFTVYHREHIFVNNASNMGLEIMVNAMKRKFRELWLLTTSGIWLVREHHEVVPLAFNYPHISRECIFVDSFNFAKNISFRNQGSKKIFKCLAYQGNSAFGWLVPWFVVGKTRVFGYIELQTFPLINENLPGKYFLMGSVFTWTKRVHSLTSIWMPSDISLNHIEYVVSVGHPFGNI